MIYLGPRYLNPEYADQPDQPVAHPEVDDLPAWPTVPAGRWNGYRMYKTQVPS